MTLKHLNLFKRRRINIRENEFKFAKKFRNRPDPRRNEVVEVSGKGQDDYDVSRKLVNPETVDYSSVGNERSDGRMRRGAESRLLHRTSSTGNFSH